MGNVELICDNLAFCYIENKSNIEEIDKKNLESISYSLEVVNGVDDYLTSLEKDQFLHDVLIIDAVDAWSATLEIISNIRKIRPKQAIVVLNDEYQKKQLLQLMKENISLCLEKPLKDKNLKLLLEFTKKISKEGRILSSGEGNDINVLQDQISKLKQEQENKEQFFANMSHEIRTPINAVLGLSHIILDSDIKREHIDYIEKIKLSGTHILNIVNDILDYSKMEAGKFSVEKIEFDLNTVLENASSMIAFNAYKKGLNFIFDVDNRIPAFLVGDPLRLSQVIINLLGNAVKFTDDGELRLSIGLLEHKNKNQVLEFRISDTGIGLSEEQIGELFQSYVQASSSTAREFGGTGLGLTISKQLVELMGGNIHVESIEGEGSTFIFTIETEFVLKGHYDLPEGEIHEKRILIVDPDKHSGNALAHMLQRYNYTTMTFDCLDDLENMLKDKVEPFDAFFIDKDILLKDDISRIEQECEAKVVITHSSLEMCTKDQFKGFTIDSRLVKPYSPEKVHLSIFDIFNFKSTEHVVNVKDKSKKDLKSLSGAHILLVEDNKINQSIVLSLLDEVNLNISIANNGEEAIAIIEKHSDIDLVLMDIEMPVMDGYEAMEILKNKNLISNIPIVALTGNIREKDIEKTKKAGMVSHLEKPMNVNALYSTLLKHIDEKHSFVGRVQESSEEILAFFGLGNHAEALRLVQRLQHDAQCKLYPDIQDALHDIEKNILKLKETFLVIVKNYNRNFTSYLDVALLYLSGEILDSKQDKILNLEVSISRHRGEENFKLSLENFIKKFRDSVSALNTRVGELKIEEAIRLINQIKREAKELNALFISQPLEPIAAVEIIHGKKLDANVLELKEIALKS